jgi:UDP-N-acetylglucosamine 4,6-dehydratase
MLTGEVLILGGSGTLGRAIIGRSIKEKWDCRITIFSTDPMKHHAIRSVYPEVQSIIGDIRDFTTLYNAMTGKDIVLHLAAQKHIPDSEYNSIDTFGVNITGSLNVAQAAMQLNIPHVLAISTDKACHPANAYGASKYAMEKIWQEFSRMGLPTKYHLLRYGNVLESTGSVIEAWKNAVKRGEPIKITDPDMTRFWLSPQQAVDLVIWSLKLESGLILIPKMPALSIGKLAEYTVGEAATERVPLRPGEKLHETLLTIEETEYATESHDFFFLRPSTGLKVEKGVRPFSSDMAPELTREELEKLLNG